MSELMEGLVDVLDQENKILKQILEEACANLNQAHNELMKAQGLSEEDAKKDDWPEWTPQANTIRWAERVLKKRLAKTEAWTEYPSGG